MQEALLHWCWAFRCTFFSMHFSLWQKFSFCIEIWDVLLSCFLALAIYSNHSELFSANVHVRWNRSRANDRFHRNLKWNSRRKRLISLWNTFIDDGTLFPHLVYSRRILSLKMYCGPSIFCTISSSSVSFLWTSFGDNVLFSFEIRIGSKQITINKSIPSFAYFFLALYHKLNLLPLIELFVFDLRRHHGNDWQIKRELVSSLTHPTHYKYSFAQHKITQYILTFFETYFSLRPSTLIAFKCSSRSKPDRNSYNWCHRHGNFALYRNENETTFFFMPKWNYVRYLDRIQILIFTFYFCVRSLFLLLFVFFYCFFFYFLPSHTPSVYRCYFDDCFFFFVGQAISCDAAMQLDSCFFFTQFFSLADAK